jgi:septal ring factor EnvC (AmiA/AmiB activator)
MMPHLNSLLKNLFKKEPSQAIKITGWLIIKKLGLITLLLTNQPVLAEKTSVTQAKKQLQQLESKINNLQRLLTHTKDKQGELNKELSATEKEIGSNIKQLRASQAALKNKQQQVILLQEEVNHLNNQLDKQQLFLAKHIRARYMMGEYQPLKWLVNQTNPSTTNRILTYYQYLIQSDQGLIKDVRQTQKNLANSQEKLHLEINKLQTLQQQLEHNQQKLIHNKRYSTSIISILNKEIQNKQQQLGDYQQNKQSLSRLLLSLTQKSMTQNQQPFMYAMKKLPPPKNESRTYFFCS